TIQHDIIQKYSQIYDNICQELQASSKLAFTLDIWTSISVKAYIEITIHFIDESWSLQQRLLNFVELEGVHSGKNIANKFIKMIIRITTDNASNNNTMLDNIELWAIEQNLNFSNKNHFQCFTHILNLDVQAGLKHLKKEIEQI
ncbi:465_t:CDS:2, partial [Gigaspora rosea]